MIVDLPSGATVTLRDKLRAKDKFAVQDAVSFSLDTTTGLQETGGGLVNRMRNALLLLLIESWTVPGAAPSEESIQDLDLDDYNCLAEAIEPMLTKVVNPNRAKTSGT